MYEAEITEKLYEQLSMVKKYLVKMGATIQDAEDIIQDTAYKFIIHMESIPIKSIESWLFRVAINHYYDICRKRKHHTNLILNFNYNELFEESTPETIILQKEFNADIYQILDCLKPKYCQFLLLKYCTGLKLSEIAILYDMKVESVKTILHRARKQFIKEYGGLKHGQTK